MATYDLPEQKAAEQDRDLGFGSSLSKRTNFRLLNRDGTFNVQRHRPTFWRAHFSYNALIEMTWGTFFLTVMGIYLFINATFAIGYLACGKDALLGDAGVSAFLRAFFFSVHTFATIGYGNVVPHGVPANVLVTIESLAGLISFALVAGLVFARFSRPTAKIIYTDHALIAPYRDGQSLQFRLLNGRDNELLEVHVSVILSRFESGGAGRQRRFYQLELERSLVTFFPLNWTVVHPIDERSPLHGWNEAMMRNSEAEVLILLSATDDAFAQVVHNRASYTADEIIWGARFLPILNEDGSGVPANVVEKLNRFERLGATPKPSQASALTT
jgi:inward rectifier potassium channel